MELERLLASGITAPRESAAASQTKWRDVVAVDCRGSTDCGYCNMDAEACYSSRAASARAFRLRSAAESIFFETSVGQVSRFLPTEGISFTTRTLGWSFDRWIRWLPESFPAPRRWD